MGTPERPYLSGISYRTGTCRQIDSLVADGVSDAALVESLKREGLQSFCICADGAADSYRAVLSASLAAANVTADSIDAVLFAPSRASWSEADESRLFDALAGIGFESGPILGVSLQACSALGGLLAQACEFIAAGSERILALLDGLAPAGAPRIDADRRTLYSDGVASAVVTRRAGEFEILAATSRSSVPLKSPMNGGEPLRQFRDTQHMVSAAVEGALRRSGLRIGDIALICSSNLNLTALRFMAGMLAAPEERLWTADLGTLGHVYGCDNLIGLSNAAAAERLQCGDAALLIGWSRHVASAVVVRRKI
jgi:3-oxoacyl-[acyl-carrier-protein] synthase III